MKYTPQVSILYLMFVERRTNNPSFFYSFIIVINFKLFDMQEAIDNDYREFLEREEELWMMEKEDLIKQILKLEAEYYANQEDEELPW